MKLKDFYYNLPKELIAQQPAYPRDSSRLMILNRRTKKIEHKTFRDVVNYLQAGDVLVLNDTKVFPARLIGRREKSGGKMEVFLLNPKSKIPFDLAQGRRNSKQIQNRGNIWQVLIGNRRKKAGDVIVFKKGLKAEVMERVDESVWLVKFNRQGSQLEKIIDAIGYVPTPPYIKIKNQRAKSKRLKDEYQTVYAQNRGSVAAPTAGFHFTKPLINKLKKRGIQFACLTLHVGLGTFEPIRSRNVQEHRLHSELAVLNAATAKKLNQAKKSGQRIMAVGTTTVRALESLADKSGRLKPGAKWTDIFIYPGHEFRSVDGLITNFHLPESSLLMLVSAFAAEATADKSALAGRKLILKAYQAAVRKKYRFYSFGDAMLIL
ncbi:MAG TPA: tRNA preQ1(34) S-adenosylmethionine ribosyltransferase-isomerase QueA [Patescibacteria group bacterium]|nr:tRNA preQ1(34) S-adenosylmethionine ribosyltransferase-isomerase QueA [Patescibacteria group bacterium]